MTTFTIRVTETEVTVHDAPDTMGVTSGLRQRTVRPETAIIRTSGDNSRITLRGPEVKASGDLTVARFEVKVSTDPKQSPYPAAPSWVLDMLDGIEDVTR